MVKKSSGHPYECLSFTICISNSIIKFICYMRSDMRAAIFLLKSEICRPCPANRIDNYFADNRVIKSLAAFMSRLEIEYLSGTSAIAETAAEDVSMLIP